MPSHHVVVLVALVAVLAGCGGTTGTDATPTTPTEHPWYGETLVVALEAPDGEYDRYEPFSERSSLTGRRNLHGTRSQWRSRYDPTPATPTSTSR